MLGQSMFVSHNTGDKSFPRSSTLANFFANEEAEDNQEDQRDLWKASQIQNIMADVKLRFEVETPIFH